MRESNRRRRLFGAIAATAAAGVLVAAPAALAQIDSGWNGSHFDEPFTSGAATMTVTTFPISGVFIHSNSPVTGVDVQFGRGTSGSFDTAPDDDCVPADPGAVSDTATTDPEHADNDPTTYEFDIPQDTVTWPCNGRFAIQATATAFDAPTPDSPDPETTSPMVAIVTVAVPPLPVTAVDAVVDDKADTITVTWAELTGDELAQDALGYRVERAGPKKGGAFGAYAPAGPSFGVDDDPLFIDHITAPGDYRYRVRALRNGADGPIASPVAGSDVAEGSIAPDPTTTTSPPTTAAAGPVLPHLGSGTRPTTTTRRPSGPPTTADTGYQGTLDYGTRPSPDTTDSSAAELASGGEGQSIIRTEGGEGVGLLAPVAGALVLLGWAGHLTYLNRLAKQF